MVVAAPEGGGISVVSGALGTTLPVGQAAHGFDTFAGVMASTHI